jgi:hypothetical protein
MLRFKSYITEAKNTHMEHTEDLIFNEGIDGTRKAINFLRDLRDMLSGHGKSTKNVTVKWDGAPAIFAGVDPSDGKFFVGTKGVFAKAPKLVKSLEDVKKMGYPPGLQEKVKVAFQEFSKLGIKKGVFQGDLMFTKGDVKKEAIAGEKYYTFQPNTIVYAVPIASVLGKQINSAKIGVVWHTTYTGNSLETMSASFGKSIVSLLKNVPSIWMDDANYKDVTGSATFTEQETEEVTEVLSQAGSLFRKIPANIFNMVTSNEDVVMRIKVYNNSFIRAGKEIPNPAQHINGMLDYFKEYFDKEIEKKASDKAKQVWTEKKNEAMKIFQYKKDLVNMIELMNKIVEAKNMIIQKLNQASSLGTFIRTSKGLHVTKQEGFVAIDNIEGAVKLVDRLEFSKANFSPDVIKGWEK